MAYTRRMVLLDGTSAQSSTYTSVAHLTADYDTLTVSWQSSGGASRMTLQGSLEDGLRASITTWSDLTGIVAQGNYTVDAGVRWMRAQRSSADSLSEVFLQGRASR